MSVHSFIKGARAQYTESRILDHDSRWFEENPTRFCRLRLALPDEFPDTEFVAVMRHPGVGRVRQPVELFVSDERHRLDDGAYPYPVFSPKDVEGSTTTDELLERVPEAVVKELFAEAGVPVESFERVFRLELARKLARHV